MSWVDLRRERFVWRSNRLQLRRFYDKLVDYSARREFLLIYSTLNHLLFVRNRLSRHQKFHFKGFHILIRIHCLNVIRIHSQTLLPYYHSSLNLARRQQSKVKSKLLSSDKLVEKRRWVNVRDLPLIMLSSCCTISKHKRDKNERRNYRSIPLQERKKKPWKFKTFFLKNCKRLRKALTKEMIRFRSRKIISFSGKLIDLIYYNGG